MKLGIFCLVVMLGIIGGGSSPITLHAQEDAKNTWVYFISNNNNTVNIYRMRPDGSNQQNLTNFPPSDRFSIYSRVLIASPDNQWLYFTSDQDGDVDIYRIRPDGSALENLTNNDAYDGFVFAATHQYWSYNGAWLAFESDREGYGQVHIMRPDGSDQQNIGQLPCINEFGGWHPSSNVIAINCSRITYFFATYPQPKLLKIIDYKDYRHHRLGWLFDKNSIIYVENTVSGHIVYRYDLLMDTTHRITPDMPNIREISGYHNGWLYFRVEEDLYDEVYRVRGDGTGLEKLIQDQGYILHYSDKNIIISNNIVYFNFMGIAVPLETDVYAVLPDNTLQIAANLPYTSVTLTPYFIDNWLYFYVYDLDEFHRHIFRVNLTTRTIEQLTNDHAIVYMVVLTSDE